MKFLTLIILFSVSYEVSALSFVPDRVATPLLDIFNKKNETIDDVVVVKVTTFDESGNLKREGAELALNFDVYEKYKTEASAVYRRMGQWRGTAFHIGHNLVLTNLHVLDHDQKNLRSCADFSLNTRDDNDTFPCKQVHFCNADLDVCLIEMSPFKKGFLRSKLVQLSDGEKLSLRPEIYEDDSAVLTAIGTTKGLGIHLSRGRGLKIRGSKINFFAPIAGGNSGGPLLDEEGAVIGVVKAETKQKVNADPEKVFNIAASSKAVIEAIRKALKDKPDTLLKFNESVIE